MDDEAGIAMRRRRLVSLVVGPLGGIASLAVRSDRPRVVTSSLVVERYTQSLTLSGNQRCGGGCRVIRKKIGGV